MEITLWIGIIIFIFSSNILISKCEKIELVERIKKSGILIVGENYTALKKLSYGNKCNFELEEKASAIGESIIPLVNKLLPLTVALQIGAEVELTENLIIEIENSLVPIKELTGLIINSTEGGLCNTSKYLYCDKSIEECQCGKSIKPKGYSYIIDTNSTECRFELGSGCLPPELELLGLKCRNGTHCVTPIANVPCDSENMIFENINNPILSQNIASKKGYICFCDKYDE